MRGASLYGGEHNRGSYRTADGTIKEIAIGLAQASYYLEKSSFILVIENAKG